MDLKQRDAHLSQYFNEEIMGSLDEAQKTTLYEEFANSELRVLATQGIETIIASANRNISAEYERRLNHINADEYPLLKEWYQSISNSVHEIICSKCGALLGIEIDTKDDNLNPHHHEGKFVVAVGTAMWAYRPRIDGVMGYQCGNIVDTEYKDDWEDFAEKLAKAQEEQAANNTAHDEAFMKYERLSPSKKKLAKKPVLVEVEIPEQPAGPPTEACGNDTRWSEIELKNIPEEHIMTSTTKEDMIKVKQEMNITGYEPPIEQTKEGYKVESFELREVK